MEQTYVYTEEDPEDELTFKKIGRFLKKGWLRMVVYALIALALAALVAVPIKVYYNSEEAAVTSIEFVYDGIEKGENPSGGSFDRDLIISPKVLTAAVEEAGLSDKIKEITTLRAAMRVDAVPDKEYYDLVAAAANGDSQAQEKLRTTTFYPTRFDIVLSEPRALDLTDSEAVLLLEKIVACYYDDFADRYSVTKMFSNSIYTMTDAASTLEFVDI